MINTILEAMKVVIALMKGKPGDALYFHKDTKSGEMYAYLVAGNNYIRYTKDALIPEFESFNEEIFLVNVLASIEQIQDVAEREKAFFNCYIPGKGLLVFGKTSVSDYVADARYRDLMSTIGAMFKYMSNECTLSAYKDFHTTPQWELYTGLKASDGAKYVNVDGKYTMYLFSGVIPTTKNDHVDLFVLDNPNYNFFMSNFEVTKWKITKKETKRLYTYNCIVCFFKI